MTAWYDLLGDGPPVVLLHAGLTDSRMWEPQVRSFTRSHRVLRVDLPGFGNSGGIARAAVVGTSLGGNTALELAIESPERVSALVLVGAGLPDHAWSKEMEAFFAAEEAALESGDVEGAVDANLRTWLAGPKRELASIDPEVRELVADMQRRAFEVQKGHDDIRVAKLDPPGSERLDEVRAPTLVLTGSDDVDDILRIADRLTRGIQRATRETIAGAAHLPNLDRPEEFDRIVLGFLAANGA
jgi:pimeloyl-ACP methyl ester carboxylesterase